MKIGSQITIPNFIFLYILLKNLYFKRFVAYWVFSLLQFYSNSMSIYQTTLLFPDLSVNLAKYDPSFL